MIIAAYDPGDEHTGIALINTDTGIVYTHQIGGYDLVELRRFNPVGIVPDVIIAEDFRLWPALAKSRSGSPLNTARILGALEMIASIKGCEFVLQQPSQKQAWPTERIERWLDIKVRGLGPHITDALRHLCIYLKKVNDDTAPLRRGKFPVKVELSNAPR